MLASTHGIIAFDATNQCYFMHFMCPESDQAVHSLDLRELQAVVGHAVAKASEIARSDCHALAEAVGDDVATHIVEWAAKARPISDMNLFEGKEWDTDRISLTRQIVFRSDVDLQRTMDVWVPKPRGQSPKPERAKSAFVQFITENVALLLPASPWTGLTSDAELRRSRSAASRHKDTNINTQPASMDDGSCWPFSSSNSSSSRGTRRLATRRVGVTSAAFTAAVKTQTSFPAFLGLVLFQKALEWQNLQEDGAVEPPASIKPSITPPSLLRRLAADEGPEPAVDSDTVMESESCSSANPSGDENPPVSSGRWLDRSRPCQLKAENATISAEAFFAVWPPECARLSLNDGFIHLLSPLRGQPNTGVITVEQLSWCIQALIERHPDLEDIRGDDDMRAAYCEFVAASLCATCGCSLGRRSMSHAEVRRSVLVDILWLCASSRLEKLEACRPSEFRLVWAWWQVLDPSGSGLASLEQLKRGFDHHLPHAVLARAVDLYGRGGGMDYPTFLTLILAAKDRMAGFSMQYWYRCVADDPWDWAGLQHFIRERRSAPDLMEIRLLDLLPQLAAGGQVSCLDIRRHQLGPLLYEILIATSPDEDYSV